MLRHPAELVELVCALAGATSPASIPAGQETIGGKKGTKKEPRRDAWLKLTSLVYHLPPPVVQVRLHIVTSVPLLPVWPLYNKTGKIPVKRHVDHGWRVAMDQPTGLSVLKPSILLRFSAAFAVG